MNLKDFEEIAAREPKADEQHTIVIVEGPPVRVEVRLFSGHHGWLLNLEKKELEMRLHVDDVHPLNHERRYRANCARKLGLDVSVPESEYPIPEKGFNAEEFAALMFETRTKFIWGPKNHGPQIIGGTDENPEWGKEDWIASGWVEPPIPSGCKKEGHYVVAHSADGRTRHSCWFADASSNAFLGRNLDEKDLRGIPDETIAQIREYEPLAKRLTKAWNAKVDAQEARVQARERRELAKEFGVEIPEHLK